MLPNVTVTQSEGLSPRQTLALPYVAASPTLAEGARAANIAKMTLTRWMRDPVFRTEYERIRQNIAELAFSELEGLTLKSVIRTAEFLDHDDPKVAQAAARTILTTAIAARRDKDLALRLETLDQAIALLRKMP